MTTCVAINNSDLNNSIQTVSNIVFTSTIGKNYVKLKLHNQQHVSAIASLGEYRRLIHYIKYE